MPVSSTSRFVSVAEFEIDRANREAFIQALLANRRETLTTEHGAHLYEICLPENEDDNIVLIEFFDDQAAYDLHHKSAHWHKWNDTAGHMIKNVHVKHLARRL
jgi:(4S)-4-hydroxy-5-phosphonooxypentane-2,3-dione isomerase